MSCAQFGAVRARRSRRPILGRTPMPLNLIHGPPNSGRAGLIRERFLAALDATPVLVVPTLDDVFAFERELCGGAAPCSAAPCSPSAASSARSPRRPGRRRPPPLDRDQRLRLRRGRDRGAARRLGPAAPLGRAARLRRAPSSDLIDELQAAGVDPAAVEAGAGDAGGLRLPRRPRHALRRLRRGPCATRPASTATRSPARRSRCCARDADPWGGRPVFLYGLRRPHPRTSSTWSSALAAAHRGHASRCPTRTAARRSAAARRLLEQLRERSARPRRRDRARPGEHRRARSLFAPRARLRRRRRRSRRARRQPACCCARAGERGEAELIAAEVARLLAAGAEPDEIAIALRDPARRGPLLAARAARPTGSRSRWRPSCRSPRTAHRRRLARAAARPSSAPRRAADLLRYLRGPSGRPAGPGRLARARDPPRARRSAPRRRCELWAGADAASRPRDLRACARPRRSRRRCRRGRRDRRATSPRGRCAPTSDGPRSRPRRRAASCAPAARSPRRSASSPSSARSRRAPRSWSATLEALDFRAWSGPVEGRVRIASPYRLRAGRFDHVFVGSLQDGEFPRRDAAATPSSPTSSAARSGLEPRRDTEAEERYLFDVCLSLPTRRLFLSYRDSDESGGAEARSPVLDEVRSAARAAAADGEEPDPVEAALTRGRGLGRRRLRRSPRRPRGRAGARARRPRASARRRPDCSAAPASAASSASGSRPARRRAPRRGRDAARPGPLANPAVIEALARVAGLRRHDAGGLRRLLLPLVRRPRARPQPLDPPPEPLIQGGLMHAVAGAPLPRAARRRPAPPARPLAAWIERGRELVAEVAAEPSSASIRPTARCAARVERLLVALPAPRGGARARAFGPAVRGEFGERRGRRAAAARDRRLGLHGRIDRVDPAPDGRPSSSTTSSRARAPRAAKFEEKANLQLPLYLLALRELWGIDTGRRPLPAAAPDHQPAPARAGPRATSRRPARGPGALRPTTSSTARSSRRCSRGGGPRRGDRGADAQRRHPARPRPAPRDRGPRQCPRFCTFAPICRRERAPFVVPQDEDEEEYA